VETVLTMRFLELKGLWIHTIFTDLQVSHEFHMYIGGIEASDLCSLLDKFEEGLC
jgi:hypothetical protein